MISTKKLCYKIVDKISSLATTVGGLSSDMTTAQSSISNMWSTIYPVGSYYETSDTSFDPSVTFGGTWEEVEPTVKSGYTGTAVTLTSYTSSSNPYTVSHDGKVQVTCGYQSANAMTCYILNPSKSGVWYGVVSSGATANSQGSNTLTLPVYAGQKIYVSKSGSSTTSTVVYYPYEYLSKRWHRTA